MICRKKLLGLTSALEEEARAAEGDGGVKLIAGILEGDPARYLWLPSSSLAVYAAKLQPR